MYEHHFLPLSPPVPSDKIEEVKPLQSIPFKCKDGVVLIVWLLGRSHTIDCIAISIPPEGIGPDRSKSLFQVFEHMLATLRLCNDANTDVVRNGDGFFSLMNQTDSPTPAYEFFITQKINSDYVVNVDNVARVFCQTLTIDVAPLIRLIGESQFSSIPPHFRFLSLYRALELMFSGDRMGMVSRFNAEAHQFDGLLRDGQSVDGALAELRTRCAHGKSRGSSAPLSGLSFGDKDIHQFVKIMRRLATDEVRKRFGVLMVSP